MKTYEYERIGPYISKRTNLKNGSVHYLVNRIIGSDATFTSFPTLEEAQAYCDALQQKKLQIASAKDDAKIIEEVNKAVPAKVWPYGLYDVLFGYKSVPQDEAFHIISIMPQRYAEISKKALSEKEDFVIVSHFKENKSLAEIGASLGVTKQRVAAIMKNAISKLRHPTNLMYFTSRRTVDEMLKSKIEERKADLDYEAALEIIRCHVGNYLDMPIQHMEISTRTKNALIRCGIRSVRQLAQYSEYDMTKVRNLGFLGLEEIKQELQLHGLGFANDGEAQG